MDESPGVKQPTTGTSQRYSNSHLFLVRLWADEARDGGSEWHGKVQHVVSGKAHYFHDWPTLVDLLMTMPPHMPPSQPWEASDTEG